jgi:acetylglutamate kinase
MVTARQRTHNEVVDGDRREYDLGRVGDVAEVDTTLPLLLLDSGYLPVVTCIAPDERGKDYNINADMFAGHLAGALRAEQYVVLTDVDGVFRDIDDPSSLVPDLSAAEVRAGMGTLVRGGMIPKLESCLEALEGGAGSARIINGMKPEQLAACVRGEPIGTRIHT